MQFVLTGFTPDTRFRVFGFQSIAPDRKRTEFTVTADLSLLRLYGILVQELPLLCREVLERHIETISDDRAFTLTEADMQAQADHRAAGRAETERKRSLRKTPPRRPASPALAMGMAR